MNLSITIAQTQTEATSRPIMTHLTSQCACRNSVISERSEEVSGSTDCATSPGFIASVLRQPRAPNGASRLGQIGQGGIAHAYRRKPDISRHCRRPHRRTAENPAKLDQT